MVGDRHGMTNEEWSDLQQVLPSGRLGRKRRDDRCWSRSSGFGTGSGVVSRAKIAIPREAPVQMPLREAGGEGAEQLHRSRECDH